MVEEKIEEWRTRIRLAWPLIKLATALVSGSEKALDPWKISEHVSLLVPLPPHWNDVDPQQY